MPSFVRRLKVGTGVEQCTPKVAPDTWCDDIRKKEPCTITECAAYCCSGDLCNGGTAPTASTITLLACAVVALLR